MTDWADIFERVHKEFVDEDDFNELVNNTKNVYERISVLEAARAGGAPVGVIGWWPYSLESIPSGWQLADGSNSTPDLRGKTIFGIASDEDDDDLLVSGGGKSHYHANPKTATDGSHDHSVGSVVTTYGGTTSREMAMGPWCAGFQHAHWVTPSISSGGAHQHPLGNTSTEDHLPPFIKLYCIIRMSS